MPAIEIRFLGTSAARPIPRWGCGCPQCSVDPSDPHARRTRSSILVNHNLLVDAGPDVYTQLRNLPYPDLALIDHIVITHPHADHFLGLDDLASLRRISDLDILPIYALRDTWEIVQEGFRYLISSGGQFDRRPFSRNELELDQPLTLPDGLVVNLLDTHHTQPFVTSGVLMERQGRRVFYASDFSRIDSDRVHGIDLLILDGSFLNKEQMHERYRPLLEEGQGRHTPILELIDWARQVEAGRVIFTHFGHLRLSAQELEAILPPGCGIAYDGMVVSL